MTKDSRCSIEGCENPRSSRGWCGKHWKRWKAHGDPLVVRPPKEKAPDRLCSIEGCERKHFGHGWCATHYARWNRHGSTDDPKPSLSERFWNKVNADGVCWEWMGASRSGKPGGYGAFNAGGKMVSSHRFAYEDLVGPIPEGLIIDHLCKNKPCVNPDHLEPVTPGENIRRGALPFIAKERGRKVTHCPRTHLYTTENTLYNTYGHRSCRTCRDDRRRKDNDSGS